ncbi:excitatory amino acid transporter 2-like [Anarhichas minor]|uniref:excitatory amino acid transporter 2-like n=1 Tax=Anarhichas minor TaxID=65739 RepID=UPI003F73EB3C
MGIGLGLILKFYVPVSENDQVYMSVPGEMLLRMLQAASVPLVVTTLMTGVCSLRVEVSRKVVVRAAAYVISTTLLSVAADLSATLPLTLHHCEKINKGISRFMLPIGTNINMNGTALFEVVTALFIAQIDHIHLEIGQLITITVTSVLLSIGAAGIPSTGAMTTFFVLTAAGLPAKEASFLVVIEWLLDRCNTVINVMGDCIGVALVHQVLKNDQEDTEEQGQEMERMHGRVAETQAPDDIQIHISPSAQDEHQSKEDSDPEILCIPPEYPPDKDMDGYEYV